MPLSASSWIPFLERIAKLLHPAHDIRIEDFPRPLARNRLDAVMRNVPFADLKLDYRRQKQQHRTITSSPNQSTPSKPSGVPAR